MPYRFSAGLPRTGQTTACRAGDDGTYQAGIRMASERALEFVNNGNGTVTDRAMGLVWVRQPELIIPGAVGVHATNQVQVARGNWANLTAYAKADLTKDAADSTYWVCAVAHTSAAAGTFAADRAAHPTYWRQTIWTASAADLISPAWLTWNDAIDACEALEYAGYTDWRLPNILELGSLLNNGAGAPPGSYPVFPNMSFTCFSSTSLALDTTMALTLQAWDAFLYGTFKTDLLGVYPVRGGYRI